MTKTKEQLEEEKKISLSIRIKPLELDGMDGDALKTKASELWEIIVRLETEKYDLEERQKRQDYDVSIFCDKTGVTNVINTPLNHIYIMLSSAEDQHI